MGKILLVGALAISLTGCISCPSEGVIEPPPRLDEAEKEIAGGRVQEGLIRFARVMKAIEKRTDTAAEATRARIYSRSFELGAVAIHEKGDETLRKLLAPLAAALRDEATLITIAARSWVEVVSGKSSQDLQMEAAGRLTGIIRLKIERPTLRRVRLVDPEAALCEMTYRRVMLENLAEFERYLLGRAPSSAPRDGSKLAEALKQLAVEMGAIMARPKTNSNVASAGTAFAERCAVEAGAALRDPKGVEAKPETRRFVEATAKDQLEDAGLSADAATAAIVKPTPVPSRVVEAQLAALRRFVYVIETSPEGDASARVASDAVSYWFPRLVDWLQR
jgi:hypothetical protein